MRSFGWCSRAFHRFVDLLGELDDFLFDLGIGSPLHLRIAPVASLPLMEMLGETVGSAHHRMFQDLGFDQIDRQDEIMSPGLGLELYELLSLVSTMNAHEVRRCQNRNEKAGLLQCFVKANRPILTKLNVISILKNRERPACEEMDSGFELVLQPTDGAIQTLIVGMRIT
ncbi:MAG: hypothetical protein AAGC99_15770 [Pseudomonadota bacterium]